MRRPSPEANSRGQSLDKNAVKERIDIAALFESDGHRLLGSGNQRMTCCPFHEERTPSCSVDAQKGLFHCFGCNAGGDVIAYVQRRDGCDFRSALLKLAACAGVSFVRSPGGAPSPRAKLAPPSAPTFEAMPSDVAETWHEGRDYLAANPNSQGIIANERGWPSAFVRDLCEDGVIGMPAYYGRRAIGFPVLHPVRLQGGRVSALTCGMHLRVSRDEGWRYWPSKKEHKRSTPQVPLTLGCSFEEAKILWIVEGEWDCATAALLVSRGRAEDDRICVLGIRGKHGCQSFLDAYRTFWPADPVCIIAPDLDRDSSGAANVEWRKPSGFRDRLALLCSRVIDVEFGAKDLNDAYRARTLTREDVWTLLDSIARTGGRK